MTRKGSGVDRAGEVIACQCLSTTLGPALVAASDRGVCSLSFGTSETEVRTRFPQARLVAADEEMRALFDRVHEAIERPNRRMNEIPIDIEGSDFQRRVWEELRAIPPGQTRSYGQLAERLGMPGGARAVGGANRANRIAVLIPCHRVVQADGSLGGYAWGLAIKSELLRREGAL